MAGFSKNGSVQDMTNKQNTNFGQPNCWPLKLYSSEIANWNFPLPYIYLLPTATTPFNMACDEVDPSLIIDGCQKRKLAAHIMSEDNVSADKNVDL